MDVQSTIRKLMTSRGVNKGGFLNSVGIEAIETTLAAQLPLDYIAFLKATNGLEVFYGYVRLFGIDGASTTDLIRWNDREQWKFAWGARCVNYWCIGEAAFGDQYAFSIDELRAGRRARVFVLWATSMQPEVIADEFGRFLEDEIVRSSIHPVDDLLAQAYSRFGPLPKTSHLIYDPSLLLGGIEDIQNVRIMDGRSAMIVNGDIALQIDGAEPDAEVVRVEPFEDDHARLRLRVILSKRSC